MEYDTAHGTYNDKSGIERQYAIAISLLEKKTKVIAPELAKEEIEDIACSVIATANGKWLNFNLLEKVLYRTIGEYRTNSRRVRIDHIENDDDPQYASSGDPTYDAAMDRLLNSNIDELIQTLSTDDKTIIAMKLTGHTVAAIQRTLAENGRHMSDEAVRQRVIKFGKRLRGLVDTA